MPGSFINERSAEMILVPNIINALEANHFKVTPVYYWASREGSNISGECFPFTPVKLLALYARRPKVTFPGTNRIFVKLNDLLFERAEIFRSEGIFAFAGVPLADSLDSLVLSVPCVYFTLENGGNQDLIEICLNEYGKPLDVLSHQLHIPEIVAGIEQLPTMNWKEALKRIGEIRSRHNREYYGHSLYGDLYKPVYLIVRRN